MAIIKPFVAIRPDTDVADRVAALPYDVYNRVEAAEEVRREPLSFLKIDRAETQFDDSVDTYAPQVYDKAKEIFESMVADGIYVTDDDECYYIYRLTMDGREQTGIVACASVDDYVNNVIKKHENTREEKEQDRIRHVDTLSAQTGPIFLAYRSKKAINDVVSKVMTEESPLYDFTAVDGIGHTVWKIAAALLSRELQKKIDKYKMPDGYTAEIGGSSTQVNDMMAQLVQALALGLLLIYLVMVAQFQSLLSPFIIIFTIPLAFTGGMLGLLAFGQSISAMSMMGFMILMGTVVNNGIVFVDYANKLRIGGVEKRAALVGTGKTRMRPILMTALTTILSMSVMVFSQDAGNAMQQGMAIVVCFGLIYSTFMTLYIVPIMYDILYRKQPKDIDTGSDDMDDIPDEAQDYLTDGE